MKIKKITLYNIGPYIDKNTFDLSIDDERNIVLIGGKNGAGKTTFFRSIKTCLYGCRVWGFEAPGKEYYSIIDSLLNTRLHYDNSAKGYIEIELLFNDGKQIDIYRLHREWSKKKKGIDEVFLIYKDGELLDEENKLNFINYLLSIIPPDMFNFYFFDGESIADFFLGNNGGKNFKNAFLKLYGLDTLSIMVENFERYFKKKDGSNSAFFIYQEAKNKVLSCESVLAQMKQELDSLENEIDLLQMKQQALLKEYTKLGGISLTEWKEINANLLKEEARREEINRWLKDVANNYIPFIIAKKQLKDLLLALETEQENKKNNVLSEMLSEKKFQESISAFMNEKGISETDRKDIIEYLVSFSKEGNGFEVLFDLTTGQTNKLIAQIYEKNDFDPERISKAIKELSSSLKQTKKLRDKLVNSSIDGYGEYSEQKEIIDKKLLELKLVIEKKQQDISMKEAEYSLIVSEFDKTRDLYEKQLKSKSITELSSRAIGVYTLLEEELVQQQGRILQQAFMECFASIINKDNFIDGIVIDKNINVIPYKFIEVSFLQIDNYMRANETSRFLELFDYKYLMEVNKLRLGEVESIVLPSPITAPFSQGERQVYIMSLYLALLKTSRKDIPFFIDTPFARIDSNHRQKIVEEFFSKINNQMFILSTDEEIVGEYKQTINNRISNTFELSINAYGNTSVCPSKYFKV